ncbi:GTPase HflX [Desulfovibrio sp. OttesenSCG-928-F07]|nr:GTPase HflX [Desulfovibrio sp. OttesenSCG-928-F07]
MAKATGNLSGLKPSQLKALNRLAQRRYPNIGGYSSEQARELAALSRSIGRQIGLLIDRQGRPFMVIAGEADSIFIPELPRERSTGQRLRGLRLLHTHLESTGQNKKKERQDLLSREDLMDLLFLRFDSMAVLTVGEWGEPLLFQQAHLLPPNPANQPYLVHQPVAWERVETDFESQTTALEEELSRVQDNATDAAGTDERCILVHISSSPRAEQESSIAELKELADTAGLSVAGTMLQRVQKVDHSHVLGKGKLAELEVLALQGNAGLIVFDLELTPAQSRNLADATERRVIDRTQLILDIFARRAGSRAGKLQVELAQMQYRLPRLIGQNKAFDRLAGRIGGRGPGETKLETDRRRLRERITKVKDELKTLRRQRSYARNRRAKAGLPIVSLVGYTNAGKSTLLNTLTGSSVLAENKLFATLDPSSRRLRFPQERELIITDTVGFIRSLPKELMEAFRATLEELEEADLLLHVADASHPEVEMHIKSVEKILESLDLHEIPRILVLNKADMLTENAPPPLYVPEGAEIAPERDNATQNDAMLGSATLDNEMQDDVMQDNAEYGLEGASFANGNSAGGYSIRNYAPDYNAVNNRVIYTSAVTGNGLDTLSKAIVNTFMW